MSGVGLRVLFSRLRSFYTYQAFQNIHRHFLYLIY